MGAINDILCHQNLEQKMSEIRQGKIKIQTNTEQKILKYFTLLDYNKLDKTVVSQMYFLRCKTLIQHNFLHL